MNASCALQHFCDIHGPQILLCTEGRTYIVNSNDTDNEDLKTFYSQYIRPDKSKEKIECKVRFKNKKKAERHFDKLNSFLLVMYIIVREFTDIDNRF